MNKIWLFLFLFSSLVLVYTKPDALLLGLMGAASNVVKLCLEFCAIYSVWMGLLEILEDSGISAKLSHLLSPLVKKLFKTENSEAIKQISISLSSNILGMGNASVPSAIKAMSLLDDKNGKLTYPMFIFMLISCCSIQLLPTTIISLRQQIGSANAYDIILPAFLSSFIILIVIVCLGILIKKIKPKGKRKKWCMLFLYS